MFLFSTHRNCLETALRKYLKLHQTSVLKMTVFYIPFHLTTQLPRKSAQKHSRSLPTILLALKMWSL